VGYVPQNVFVMDSTLADNVSMGEENADPARIEEALRKAQLWELVEQLSEGIATHIGEAGCRLAGGQKQRLCIARALLKKPKILILDDSTSACDTETDARIQRAFREQLPEVTKLIIAQRIQSVMYADRIIVMQSGQVTGFDTHENLLKNNALYQEIYQIQTKDKGDFDSSSFL
jgi:ATP-binding cassette subfamily B protein